MMLLRRVTRPTAARVRVDAHGLRVVRDAGVWRQARASGPAAAQLLLLAATDCRREWSAHKIGMRSFSTAATATKPSDVDAALVTATVEQLRALCKGLYVENRGATTEADVLTQWETTVTALLEPNAHPELQRKIQQAYEQAVAITHKQRDLGLSHALFQQIKRLGLEPSDATYGYLIRGVALEWLARERPMSLADLRAFEFSDNNWEKAVLELVRTEDQPHYRKSYLERTRFHEFLRNGVTTYLKDYEATVALERQKIAPYNAALRVFAANDMQFSYLLRLLNHIPRDSPARACLDWETYHALLQGARWDNIVRTLDRLKHSKALEQFEFRIEADEDEQRRRRSQAAAALWDQAMRSICNSFTERFSDKRQPIDTFQLKELQTIYERVDAKIQRMFPQKGFETIEQHNAVYDVRVKAAALCGLPRSVQTLLNEYKEHAPVDNVQALGTSVFLKAMEVYPSLGLKRVTRYDVDRVRTHCDVSSAVSTLERSREHLVEKVIPAAKDAYHTARHSANRSEDEVETLKRALRSAETNARKLKHRIEEARDDRSYRLVLEQRLQSADRGVDGILQHLEEVMGDDVNPLEDLDVASTLLTQYMTIANRFSSRMSAKTRKVVGHEVTRRVFEVLKIATRANPVESDEDTAAKLKELFSLGAKTLATLWREEDLERLLRRKMHVFNTKTLDASDYDRLIFLRAAQLDLGSACGLMQEMQNAGLAPTSTTIHRVVTGVLHKLYHPRGVMSSQLSGDESSDREDDVQGFSGSNADDELDNEVMGFHDELEAEDERSGFGQRFTQASIDGPRTLEDVTTFLQDWYNLTGVKPTAKTVVPVFARLLTSNNVPEVKRLLQVVDAMDGGLSPATEFWLEKRLEAVGKTVDDLRVVKPSRR
ncbi:hypothetical protein Poli38472_007968 [Pythium oligandrum]|uniref:Uncharacterized protein n=1 Tax=Pythium oligandrum TaxID=41045 RepID=A0A8K1FJV1_PYTOL|nr:hypothetical protein Poli38472_007968 [Pythium oligandrum]|eukprot:TMW65326.1 hypothetical protein Poli38472_007968 [Pythium oligandrum]